MNFLLAVKLALRYLGLNTDKTVSNARKSLYGAVWGIGISIVPLIVVLVVSDGMIKGISSRIIELSSGHLQLFDLRSMPRTKTEAAAQLESAQKIFAGIKEQQIDGCTGMWIQREGTGLLIGKKGRGGGTIRAIEPDYFVNNTRARALLTVIDGTLALDSPRSILLGKKIAEDTGLCVGDTCTVLTLLPSYKNEKTVPKLTRFTVTGILSSGYQELDALWMFIPLTTGNTMLSHQASLLSLFVSTADPFDNTVLDKVADSLSRLTPDGFSLYRWQYLNRSQFYSFQTSKNLLLFIMFLIVLAASVNISSAMIMLIMERRKEIAILKAAGAHPFFITLSFLLAGILTAAAGLSAGMLIGIPAALHINEIFLGIEYGLNRLQFFCHYLLGYSDSPLPVHILNPEYYLEHIPVDLQFYELYIIAAGTLILSIIVCIIPAFHAGKEKPLDSMRKIQ